MPQFFVSIRKLRTVRILFCLSTRIRWAASRMKPVKSVNQHDSAATVYVRFAVQISGVVVSEDSLRSLFSNYGLVFDANIKKLSSGEKVLYMLQLLHSVRRNIGLCLNYSFISFSVFNLFTLSSFSNRIATNRKAMVS